MADSPASSDLSDPPSVESDTERQSPAGTPSHIGLDDFDQHAPPTKRRKTGPSALAFDRALSSQPDEDIDNISISSDGWSSAPGSPTHNEFALREEAQTQCLWLDCEVGDTLNNDELVKHVQTLHCPTGGPKKSKYVCLWGECQRKTSNHPSGYALKAHMRSHTKEKPYYCALPECDKSFTRSDALAKHMRTVHEPEQVKAGPSVAADSPAPTSRKGKAKFANGLAKTPAPPVPDSVSIGPVYDEDGNPVEPSHPNDNITYLPAHHPVTGQPGFMIHYPSDIHFTSWESSINADQLMRVLRRQLHWARKESEEIKRDLAHLEQLRREEWTLKEILLEGVMEAELARGLADERLRDAIPAHVSERMEHDVAPSKRLMWSDGKPDWRRGLRTLAAADVLMRDGPNDREDDDDEDDDPDADITRKNTPATAAVTVKRTPSPPGTGRSGGFDGDQDPYDNYLSGIVAQYEARQQRARSLHSSSTPLRRGGDDAVFATAAAASREEDAAGALMGLSNGPGA
nr:ino80 complex subunit 1 [Quercus suber]